MSGSEDGDVAVRRTGSPTANAIVEDPGEEDADAGYGEEVAA